LKFLDTVVRQIFFVLIIMDSFRNFITLNIILLQQVWRHFQNIWSNKLMHRTNIPFFYLFSSINIKHCKPNYFPKPSQIYNRPGLIPVYNNINDKLCYQPTKPDNIFPKISKKLAQLLKNWQNLLFCPPFPKHRI